MSRLTDIIFDGAQHYITSKYGYRTLGGSRVWHGGTDYGTHLKNLPQYAVEDGEVYATGYESWGAGYYIWIKYPRLGKRMLHCHLQKASPLRRGDRVTRGTLVGYTGTTGNSTGIHLHLGIRDLVTGATEDPEAFAASYTGPAANGTDAATDAAPGARAAVGTPVAVDSAQDGLVVHIANLNARRAPGLAGERLGFVAPGSYRVYGSAEADGHTWYEIEPGLWCASGQGWTTFRAGRPTLYAVSFPLVSAGDKNALVQLGDERRLQYTVSERKEE